VARASLLFGMRFDAPTAGRRVVMW